MAQGDRAGRPSGGNHTYDHVNNPATRPEDAQFRFQRAPWLIEEPGDELYASIVQAQAAAQPFVYPDGLVEVPMSPLSDISAFRTGRWRLEWFLEAVRRGALWAIEHRAVYDFLAHPSCLYVTYREFRAIGLILDLVKKAGNRAAIVGLATLAARARLRTGKP